MGIWDWTEAFWDWTDGGHSHGHGHGHAEELPTARDWPAALADDPRAAGLELQATLLAAALTSGRHKQTATPCPPEFEERITFVDMFSKDRDEDDGRDYDTLRNALASLPPIALAHEAPPAEQAKVAHRRSHEVARWSGLVEWLDAIVEVRSTPVERQSRAKSPLHPPTHQFAVRQRSAAEGERWAGLERQGHTTCKCYFGAAVEEFHSILSGGFSETSEVSLCDTLDMAREDAPAQSVAARRWGPARYEQSISCVAICEKLLTPDEFEGLAKDNGSPRARRPTPAKRVRVIGLLLFSSAEAGDATGDDGSLHITLGGDQVELIPVGEAGSAARMWIYMIIIAAVALRNSTCLEWSPNNHG